MKKKVIQVSAISMLTMSLSGCAIVEGIFKAGMIWGILLVFMTIFGLIYLFSRGRGK